jgi:hypothetical protein
MPRGPTQPPVQCVKGVFPGGKAAEAWCWTPTPPSTEVTERVVILLLLIWAFKDCSKVSLLLLPKESNIIMSDGNELRKDLEISSALGEMSQLMIVILSSYLCLLCSQPTGWTIRGSNSCRGRRFISFSKRSDRLWVSGLQLNWYRSLPPPLPSPGAQRHG